MGGTPGKPTKANNNQNQPRPNLKPYTAPAESGAGAGSNNDESVSRDLIYVSPQSTPIAYAFSPPSGLVKVAIFGGGGIGKSALTIMFVQNHFVEDYDPTIEDSYRKQLRLDETTYIIEVLDTAPSYDSYYSMTDQYIRSSEGFILMYSGTDRNSYDEVQNHIDKIARIKDIDYTELGKIAVIVCNKYDLQDNFVISSSEMHALADKIGTTHYTISVKNQINVNVIFEDLSRKVSDYQNIGSSSTPVNKKPVKRLCGIPNEEAFKFEAEGEGCCHDSVREIMDELWKLSEFSSDLCVQKQWQQEIAQKISVDCMKSAKTENELKVLIAQEISLKKNIECQN